MKNIITIQHKNHCNTIHRCCSEYHSISVDFSASFTQNNDALLMLYQTKTVEFLALCAIF